MDKGELITCDACRKKTLPGPASHAGVPLREAPKTIACPHCGAIHRVNKWRLWIDRNFHAPFWLTFIISIPAVIMSSGAALLAIIPAHYIVKWIGRLLKPKLYRRTRWSED